MMTDRSYVTHILALTLLCFLWSECKGSEPLQESACFFMLGSSDTDSVPVRVPDLNILHPPSDQPDFVVELDPEVVLSSVVCRRNRPEVSANDERVISAGYSFYVISGDPKGKGDVMIALERTEVGYRARLISGKLSKKQGAALVKGIEELNRRQFGPDVQPPE